MKQKHWQVSVFDKTSETIKNDTFYTTDTEAYLVFELIDEDFKPDFASITVYNVNGKVTIHLNVDVVDGIVRYEIPQEAIEHLGVWKTQVIFTKNGEDYTTNIIEFEVSGHLLDKKKPKVVIITNWNHFIKHAGGIVEAWEHLEEIRQVNEQQRELAESKRKSNESVRLANEEERISKDSERDSKIETLEEQFQNVIDETTGKDVISAPELIAARNGEANLKTRLDKDKLSLTAQLQQTEQELNAQLAQTAKQVTETDYVEIAKNMNYFEEITFIKTHDGGMQQFELYLKNENGEQKMTFIKPDDYFKLSGVVVSAIEKGNSTQEFLNTDVSYSGNWTSPDNNQIVFATSVGSYFEVDFEVVGKGGVSLSHFSDNRGGIFEATIDGGNPVSFTTFSETSETITRNLYDNITEGEHTLRVEFMGEDPSNPPSSGSARGWLVATRNGGVENYFLKISGAYGISLGHTLTLSNTSNKEFAFLLRPLNGTKSEWVPQHAVPSAVNKSEPVFVLDGEPFNIAEFNIGQEYKGKNFKLIQDIYGRHPESGNTDLVNIKTIHSISLDGNINITGSMNVLEDVNISSSYVVMAPVNNELFDVLQTGWGNQYELSKSDNSSTVLTEGADCGNYVYLSEEDYFVAYRHSDKRGNFALGDNTDKDYHNFINHRSETLVKHYINLFDNQVLPAGYKYRWSGDYVTGKMNGAYELMSG